MPDLGASEEAMNASDTSSTQSTTPSQRKSIRKHASTSSVSQRHQDPRVGTRSVSTLSTSQLERKRANDREAQRIIRQRTREHIESLEQKVSELDGQKQQLDRALQRNVELEGQIAALQSQVTELMRLLQHKQGQDAQGYVGMSPYEMRSALAAHHGAPDANEDQGQHPFIEQPVVTSTAPMPYIPPCHAEPQPPMVPYGMQLPTTSHIPYTSASSSASGTSTSSAGYRSLEETEMPIQHPVQHLQQPTQPVIGPGNLQLHTHHGPPPPNMGNQTHHYNFAYPYHGDTWSYNR